MTQPVTAAPKPHKPRDNGPIRNFARTLQTLIDNQVVGGLVGSDRATEKADRWISDFEESKFGSSPAGKVVSHLAWAVAHGGNEFAHFLLGLEHGLSGMGTGLVGLVGYLAQLTTSSTQRSVL